MNIFNSLHYDHANQIPDLFLAEARICEILKKHPHPNIVQYFGCVTQNDRITGLYLVKYLTTLQDRLKGDRPVPRDILKETQPSS
jgi:hypothetical protein